MNNYVDGYMFCAGNDGVFREYDASLDFTIHFEDKETMDDFGEWLMNGGGNEAFERWREMRKSAKEEK